MAQVFVGWSQVLLVLALLVFPTVAGAGAQEPATGEPPAAPTGESAAAAPTAETPEALPAPEPVADSDLLPLGRAPRPGIVTGGEPSAEQLGQLAARGYRTVVSLRTDGEPTVIGEDEVEALGLRWVRIPVAGAAGLTRENVDALAAAVADPEVPTVVYCGSGNRVGALFALDAAWRGGATPEDALAVGLEAGLTRLEPAVRELLGLPPLPPAPPSQ